jgi:hypothetical protein
MDLYRLAYFLKDFVAAIVEIDGRLFVDRKGEGEAVLREKIAGHRSSREAQSWMNNILVEQFIDEIVGDNWSMNDPEAQRVLRVYEEAWTYQIAALHPAASFKIERIIDEGGGDFGLRLVQD